MRLNVDRISRDSMQRMLREMVIVTKLMTVRGANLYLSFCRNCDCRAGNLLPGKEA